MGAYYKFAKQIEPKVAVSYHQSLHFQMEYSYQPVLFVEDSSMLDIVGTPTNGNSFEMHHKVRLQFANDYMTWLPYDWKRIIWTDEAHFGLFNRKNRTPVRRTRSESEKPFSFVPRMHRREEAKLVCGAV